MESLTKNKQSEETIRRMVEKFFAPLEMVSYRELTEGFFNVAYEVSLSDGEEVILKVAPAKGTRIMSYEQNIMYTETQAMKMAERAGNIPVPRMLGFDTECTRCSSPYFFMEKLKGDSLNAIKDTLSREQLDAVYLESGRINRRINEICCPCFGYPGQPAIQGEKWFPVFMKMMEAGIRDAEAGRVELHVPAKELFACLKRDEHYFDEVTVPRLVHWDCWDGNIFVADGQITGFIDWERSLWADPLMEVGFRVFSDQPLFRKGYGLETLTQAQERRAVWYDIYTTVLMSLECEYRQYETMDFYNWSNGVLQKQFGIVKKG